MKQPVISPKAHKAYNATLFGNVVLKEGANVWFHATLRGDCSLIEVGKNSNVQDNCVIHVEETLPVLIGENVTIGHAAILHGCTVGDNSVIGMGAIVMDGAKIGKNCMVAAGALVTQHTVIPDGMLVMGSPAKVRRALTAEEVQANIDSALGYAQRAAQFAQDGWFTRD